MVMVPLPPVRVQSRLVSVEKKRFSWGPAGVEVGPSTGAWAQSSSCRMGRALVQLPLSAAGELHSKATAWGDCTWLCWPWAPQTNPPEGDAPEAVTAASPFIRACPHILHSPGCADTWLWNTGCSWRCAGSQARAGAPVRLLEGPVELYGLESQRISPWTLWGSPRQVLPGSSY